MLEDAKVDPIGRTDQLSTSPALVLGHFRLSFLVKETIKLPRYSGSAWRGLFGHALKKAVCVTRESKCEDCLLYHGCAYPYIFETSPPLDTERMRKYNAVPHPFVIYPLPTEHQSLAAGSVMQIEFIVCGRAINFLPYMVYAFQSAGEQGFGKGRSRFELTEVEQNTNAFLPEDWQSIMHAGSPIQPKAGFVPGPPPCPNEVLVTLQTPLRVKREERLVGPTEFEFHDLFRSLLRRIAMLIYFHENKDIDVDFTELTRMAKCIAVSEKKLKWKDWTRYSSRQKTAMQMGGLVGSFRLEKQILRPLWPFLWLGQWIHAGKGASMGLGRYRLKIPASLPEQREIDV